MEIKYKNILTNEEKIFTNTEDEANFIKSIFPTIFSSFLLKNNYENIHKAITDFTQQWEKDNFKTLNKYSNEWKFCYFSVDAEEFNSYIKSSEEKKSTPKKVTQSGKKRANGKGSVVYLPGNRINHYAAKISIGRDINGKNIAFYIKLFPTKLDALVFLENYHKDPYPLYIKKSIYDRIATFPKEPYPLVPVENPHKIVEKRVQKDNYTFKQLYEEFAIIKLPNKEERMRDKHYHIKPKGKYAYGYSRGLITAFHNCTELYDKVYKELRTSDFQNHLDTCGKNWGSLKQIVNLFMKLDEYALQEDIITKGYAQHVKISETGNPSKNHKRRTPLNYEQIQYLWNITPENSKEEFIRDFLLIALYTGARAEELLFIYTKNIFLDKNYFVAGLKTKAGINREIPIHPDIKPIFEKYYNPENEFLFMQPNGRRINYDYYQYHYKFNFKSKHPFLENHTAHECRHTLRTELERLNIKKVIINAILGHSNDNVGEDIYTHISIEEKLEAIKLVTYIKAKKLYILASNDS